MLSVIIPVYNTAQTLDACVESVLQQHVDEMQLLLVDDASPDEAPARCDAWAAQHPQRIRVIHQPKNSGLSAARNAALDVVLREGKSDIITFVDSDDRLSPNTYAPLLHLMAQHPDVDMLEYAYQEVPYINKGVNGSNNEANNGNDKVSMGCNNTDTAPTLYADAQRYWLQAQAYTHTYAWNKLYRTTLWREVRYPVGRTFEDMHTLPRLLNACRQVLVTHQGTYLYTHNPNGITANASATDWASLLEASLVAWQKYGLPMGHNQTPMGHNHNNNGHNQRRLADLYYMYVLNIQLQYCKLSGKAPTLPYRPVCLTALPRRFWLKGLLLRVLGVNGLAKVIAGKASLRA